MSTITLVMYSSTSTITFLRTRVRVLVLKKYSYSSTSTSVRLLHLWYILDRCFCSLSITLLAVLTTRASFVLFLALTLPYHVHVILLKDITLYIKPLCTSRRKCWLTSNFSAFSVGKVVVGLTCKHNQHDHRMTSSHQVKYG